MSREPISREPTHADLAVLLGVVEAVRESEAAVEYVNAALDKLDAGGTLSPTEIEEYRLAHEIIAKARWAIAAWESWWPG